MCTVLVISDKHNQWKLMLFIDQFPLITDEIDNQWHSIIIKKHWLTISID